MSTDPRARREKWNPVFRKKARDIKKGERFAIPAGCRALQPSKIIGAQQG
jgi:hypothetical protein